MIVTDEDFIETFKTSMWFIFEFIYMIVILKIIANSSNVTL